MGDFSKTQSELEVLLLDSQDFQTLTAKLNTYCPFEATTMVDAEIRNSKYLASVMNPSAPHGFGTGFLREVLDTVLQEHGASLPLSRIELHLANLDGAEVIPEWRNIDILVKLPDIRVIVAFELKIGAKQGKVQLETYRSRVVDEWPREDWKHVFIFLNRVGEVPSDEAWLGIGYEFVSEAITKFLDSRSEGVALARDFLRAYGQMLRRKHMQDDELEELARKIWMQHGAALKFLRDRSPDGENGVGGFAKENIAKICSDVNITLGRNTLRALKSNNTYVNFILEDWVQAANSLAASSLEKNFPLVISLETRNGGIVAKVVIQPGPPELRNALLGCFDEKPNTSKHTGILKGLIRKARANPDDEVDYEDLTKEIVKKLSDYIKENVLPKNDAVVNVLSGLKLSS